MFNAVGFHILPLCVTRMSGFPIAETRNIGHAAMRRARGALLWAPCRPSHFQARSASQPGAFRAAVRAISVRIGSLFAAGTCLFLP